MKTSLPCRFLLCALALAAHNGRALTPDEAGVPKRLQPTIMGTVDLNEGGTRTLSMSRYASTWLESNEKVSGTLIRSERANWNVFGPGSTVNPGEDTVTIKATRAGQGYIQGYRYLYYMDNGVERRNILIQIWLLKVHPLTDGSSNNAPTGSPGGAWPTEKPDIPRAVIKGRAVMRGTDTGVPGAYIELIGARTGTLRTNWETGADGGFNIKADNMLSADRYEIFIRKGSANAAREDAVMEDLWPIRRYYVTVTRDNCLNLNLGRIEMASVEDLWGADRTAGADAARPELDITPKAGPGAGGGQTTPSGQIPGGGQTPGSATAPGAGGGQAPGTGPTPGGGGQPPAPPQTPDAPDAPGTPQPLDDSVPVLIAPGAIGAAAAAQSLQIVYKGYVEVDFNLKATMTLKLAGSAVTGELYAPPVSQPNVRLPGARMLLDGTLAGGWEDGGRITGSCTGHILWPDGKQEERAGQFQIAKAGAEIHFRSTKFYYNHYIFGALGIKYAGGNAVTNAAGTSLNSVLILIDASGSMQGEKINRAKSTACRRIAELGPETELAVIAFSGNSLKFQFAPMDDDGRARAQEAVNGVSAGGGTPLAAAIRSAGSYIRGNARSKNKTLIILSDGEESEGGNPPEEIRKLNDVTVN